MAIAFTYDKHNFSAAAGVSESEVDYIVDTVIELEVNTQHLGRHNYMNLTCNYDFCVQKQN